MKKITFTQKALALLLALAMVVSGIYIPRSNVKIVQAAEETETNENTGEPTEQTAVPENAVAKVGDNYYETFEAAITAANGTESDVTVTLLKNITASSVYTFNNTNGNKITIDGNDCTVTAGTGVTNLFDIQCEFELKNVTVEYKGKNAAFVINVATTTSFKDVIINAENVGPNANSYLKDAIIDVCAAGEHTLNLTNTNIIVTGPDGKDLNSTFYPIIRTNAGLADDPSIKSDTRIVTMNLTNSTLDASAAVGRLGIWSTRGTRANIILDNSHIKTTYGKGSSTVKNRTIYAQIVKNAALDDKVILTGGSTLTCTDGVADPFNFITCVARIGNEFYETFGAAVTAANAATENVTLEFFSDITLNAGGSGKNAATFTNANINAITIDGKGHKVTATNGNNTFRFESTTLNSIQLKNMEIEHKNVGAAVQVTQGASTLQVDISDVTVTATAPYFSNVTYGGYQYALFNMLASNTTNLNLTRVNVDMDDESGNASLAQADTQAIVRTGNAGTTHTVNIKLEDCLLDATGATLRYGIAVMKNTTSRIELIGTTQIKTKDYAPIYSWSLEDATGVGRTTNVKTNCTSPVLYFDEYESQIGNTLYQYFEHPTDTNATDAVKAANSATKDVTIEILKDIDRTFATAGDSNAFSFTNTTSSIAIDGNNHTFTAAKGANTFRFNSGHVGNIALKNMTIDHRNYGAAIQVLTGATVTDDVTTGGTVTIENVTINATQPNSKYSNQYGYEYALINLLNGKDVVLNMKNVDVTMETSKAGHGSDVAIIRTGNTGDEKNVTMILEDCILNSRGAEGRYGILIMDKTTADITLKGTTKIETNNVAAIRNKATKGHIVRVEGCTFDSVDAGLKNKPFSGFDAQVGNKVYGVFATAIAEAEAGATVEVLQDLSTGWRDITKSMTIDGNGYEITSTAGDASNKFLFVVKDDATEFKLKDLDIKHLRRGMVVRTDIPTTVTMENVNIDATEAPVSTEYALFNLTAAGTTNLIWNNVTVDMDATTAGLDANPAIIRTGNDDEKVVNITLTDCDLNTEGAEGRHGITIISKTTATLNLTRTNITTLDVLPIKDNTGNATVNTTDCTLTYTGIEAIIGNNLYKTFAEALAAANEASENVTIQILKDIEIGSANEIKNSNGASITIEGHNHELVLNATGGQHTFMITTTQVGTVEFKNMTIKHHNHGSAVQIVDNIAGEKLTVKLTDVIIDATEPVNTTNGYEYAIINVLNKNTTDLLMTDVIVRMSTTLPGKDNSPYWGIIRTGNPGSSNAKKVNITLDNCELDASGAAGRHGIVVVANTTANITLKNNTKIKTNDVAPIKNYSTTSQKLTIDDDCIFEATVPIDGYVAQIDNVLYTSFNTARTDANKAKESVTIKLLTDLEVAQNVWINNENGKTITIDGNGHKVETVGGSNVNAFCVDKTCTVVLKNMTVEHKNMGSVVQVTTNANGVNLSLIDVTINANDADNDDSNYRYALINIAASATVNLTNVIVDMDVTTAAKDFPGIVRTGNHNQEKTVTINVHGGNWNTEGAIRRHGIVIMNDTHAEVNLIGASITTADAAPIADYSQTAVITRDDATTTTCTGNYEAYVLTLGNQPTHTAYETFADALTAANGFKGSATLGLLKDVSVKASNGGTAIGNADGKLLVEGNTHTITTENGNHAFTVNQSKEVEFRNLTIAHKGYGAAIQVNKADATLTLTNVFLDATYASELTNTDKTYNYTMINLTTSSTLNMVNSNVTMVVEPLGAGGGNQSSIIRTGNKDSADDTYKEITINLTDCILDATGATNRSGILVVDAKADINLKGSTKILTGAYLEGKNCAAIRGLEGTKVAKISMEETCVLMTGESTAYADVIKNIEAGITDACVWTYKLYENLTAFRTTEGLKVPTNVPTGYIFAGWYTDKACTQEYALSNTDIETTSAYAKFVPEHVLGVKAQVPTYLKDGVQEGEAAHIRFVTTVDSLDYLEIGFDYTITLGGVLLKEGTAGNKNNTVYRKLYAIGAKNGEVLDLVPEYTFCAVSQYFKAITVTNIPEVAFDAAVTVTPFWRTLDGTKVYGESVTKTVNQGIASMNGDGMSNGSEFEESTYTNRVVMVSDLHYTTSMEKEEYDEEYQIYDPNSFFGKYLAHLNPNASWAAGNAFGYTQEEKIQAALDDIHAYGASVNNNINAVMVLGDLTLDDYGYRNLVDNYLDDFKTDFLEKLNYARYAIAGNHDSYTDSEWEKAIGSKRQYSVEIEGSNAVFMMLDTFAAQHATGSNGSEYIGIDVEWLEAELAKYPTQNIFLCTHYYQEGVHPEKDAALNALMKQNSRIVSLFRAHSHKNTVKNPATLAGAPIVDIGGYAYNGQQEDNGSYDFNIFNKTWAWGYQVIEWNEDEVHIYHVKPARNYTDSTGKVHNYKGAIEDDIVIKLSR